eukprot:scaffold30415_cov124-Isochrysis_galbana.AAC.7
MSHGRTSSRAALSAMTTALPRSPPRSASAVMDESTEAELEAVAGRETAEPVVPVEPVGGRAVDGREPPEPALRGREASAAAHSAVALYRVHSAPVVVYGLRGSPPSRVNRSKPSCRSDIPRIARTDERAPAGCAVRGRRGKAARSPRMASSASCCERAALGRRLWADGPAAPGRACNRCATSCFTSNATSPTLDARSFST